ncbi:MAG: ABC transporter permease [bacterium]
MTHGDTARATSGLWVDAARRFAGHRLGVAAASFLVVLALTCLGAGIVQGAKSEHQDATRAMETPSHEHWLGTDRLGRDLMARLLAGGRVSLGVSVATALTALLIGTGVGLVSGYAGGWVDEALMRLVEVVYSLPDLLVITLFTLFLGREPIGIVLALASVGWVSEARLVRGLTMRVREEAFVEAGRALGASRRRLLVRHVLPNLAGPILVALTFQIPSTILAESTLSFLGLGLRPPNASWGTLVNEGWLVYRTSPHLLIAPSVVLVLTGVAFNVLGDAMRDVLDPRSAGRR